MIELRDIAVRTRRTIAPTALTNVNLRIEERDRLALLSPSKATLKLILDTLCAANAPDAGSIIRTSSISWPIPSNGFFHKHQTFVANARFIAHLYEMDQRTFIPNVIELAGVQDLADERLDHCPSTAVSRFAFALGIALPFDIYLLTSTGAGDKKDRQKYSDMVAELANRSGLVVATANGKAAKSFCDKGYVLDPAGCTLYDNMDAALEHLDRLIKRTTKSADEEEEMAEDEERVFEDFL
jgi:capsular polysaccharide transport system ATP-binding protein